LQPPDDLGTPGPYRSPELILEKAAGVGSDLWALGCTLFEIRTGRKLFDLFDDDDDSYLDAMVQILGKMPEPWWSTKWERRKKIYKDEVDDQGRAAAITEYVGNADEFRETIGVTRIVHPSVAEGARSLQDKLAPGFWYLSSERGHSDRHWDISEREKEVFAKLLSRLLEYDPNDRIGAKAAIDHEWFKL
jgi:serine/threonine protein kinase